MTDPSRRDQAQDRGATTPSRPSPEAPDPVESDGRPVSHQLEDAREEMINYWSEQRRRRATPRDQRRTPPDRHGDATADDVPGEDSASAE